MNIQVSDTIEYILSVKLWAIRSNWILSSLVSS